MNYPKQDPRPRSSFSMPTLHKCSNCDKLVSENDIRCIKCNIDYVRKKAQELIFVNKSFCPRCGMSLGEHKEIELKLCLFNLRGILQSQLIGDVSRKTDLELR